MSLRILDVDLSQPLPGTGEGGRVTAVLPFKGSVNASLTSPSWSPDGRQIVYEHWQQTSEPDGYAFGTYIVVADVETGAETVVRGPGNVGGPDWDPLDFIP
jgi:Tol biopolymer transport system component